MSEIFLPKVTRNDDNYTIASHPEFEESIKNWAYALEIIYKEVVSKSELNTDPVQTTQKDVFSQLEQEMANDTVKTSTEMRLELQSLVLLEFLTQLHETGTASVAAENITMVSRALNRIYFTLQSMTPAEEREESIDPVVLLCSLWANRILESYINFR